MWAWIHEASSKFSAMGVFIVGNISGAIISTAVDRCWRHFESKRDGKIKLRIQGGIYQSIGNIDGISLTVTNISAQPIPQYEVALFHPQRGSLFIFDESNTGPLLPDQERRHQTPILQNRRPNQNLIWFQHIHHKKIDNPTGDEILFRIIMKDSDRVLYESRKMGEALGSIIINASKVGSFEKMSHEESMAIQDVDRKYKKQQKAMMAEIEASHAKLIAGQAGTSS